jgi:hypothetical protein
MYDLTVYNRRDTMRRHGKQIGRVRGIDVLIALATAISPTVDKFMRRDVKNKIGQQMGEGRSDRRHPQADPVFFVAIF